MESEKEEPSAEDLRLAIGGLLTVLGSMVPPPVAKHMASQLKEFADHCTRNQQASVGTLATGFAKALDIAASVPTPPRH